VCALPGSTRVHYAREEPGHAAVTEQDYLDEAITQMVAEQYAQEFSRKLQPTSKLGKGQPHTQLLAAVNTFVYRAHSDQLGVRACVTSECE
jgi:hypothetical protein